MTHAIKVLARYASYKIIDTALEFLQYALQRPACVHKHYWVEMQGNLLLRYFEGLEVANSAKTLGKRMLPIGKSNLTEEPQIIILVWKDIGDFADVPQRYHLVRLQNCPVGP